MNGTIKSLAAWVLVCTASWSAQAQDIQGDALAGSHKNALCIGCHGIRGFHTAFPETYQVPKLSGQSAKYIVTALHAYQSGQRKHPSMRTMANALSAQDMADLAAYYASTGTGATLPAAAQPGSVQAEALVAKGGCPACHGANFSKPVDPAYPKLAGQHADYLYMALRGYKQGDKPFSGRNQPIMAGVAKQFTDAELKVLADHVSRLPTELQTIQPSRFK